MKEKIKNLLWRFDICRAEESETIDGIQELADDFAIGFGKWLSDNNTHEGTIEELLQIYKKQLSL